MISIMVAVICGYYVLNVSYNKRMLKHITMYYKVTNEELVLEANNFLGGIL